MEYEPINIVRLCFHLIDKTAKKVLESDEIEDISLDLLKSIIQRDSLCVPSELSVWQALNRWSHRQCRRRHISPSIGNKIEVLEGAQYSVRYLTMTSKQFKVASSLLAKEEEESIIYNLLHTDSSLIKSIQEYQVSMNTPRNRTGRLWKHVWRTKVQNNQKKKDKMTLVEQIFFFIVCILD